MDRDPLALARLQMRSHYVLDDAGRIVRVNDVGEAPDRQFAMIRTAAGNVFAVGQRVERGIAAELAALAAEEPVVDDFEHESVRMLGPAARLLSAAGEPRRARRGPAFVALDDPPLQPLESAVRELHQDEATLLHDELAGWRDEIPARWPAMVAFAGGRGAAICASARLTAEAAAAGLETAPSYRRTGLAVAAAAAWIRAVRASGRAAFYSTEWENTASRAVAARLGVRLFGEDVHII